MAGRGIGFTLGICALCGSAAAGVSFDWPEGLLEVVGLRDGLPPSTGGSELDDAELLAALALDGLSLARAVRPDDSQPFALRGGSMLGDTNGDQRVDQTDLQAVLDNFAQAGDLLAGDIDGDGMVTFSDLNIVLSMFGASIPSPGVFSALGAGFLLAGRRRRL